MTATYFGNKTTCTNKAHECFGCTHTIDPGNKTRHDVWKEAGKMVNKYYCKNCETLLNTQATLDTNDGKPYNPTKWELIQRFPYYFQPHFVEKYCRSKRLEVLQDLQMTFISKWGPIKYRLARIFGLKSWYKFDFEDYKQFSETYKYTKHHAYFICNK